MPQPRLHLCAVRGLGGNHQVSYNCLWCCAYSGLNLVWTLVSGPQLHVHFHLGILRPEAGRRAAPLREEARRFGGIRAERAAVVGSGQVQSCGEWQSCEKMQPAPLSEATTTDAHAFIGLVYCRCLCLLHFLSNGGFLSATAAACWTRARSSKLS